MVGWDYRSGKAAANRRSRRAIFKGLLRTPRPSRIEKPRPLQVEPGAPPVPAKKEKPAKKKPKIEAERGPRPRKSEKRVIEEKIALEESEHEALSAIKEGESEAAEAPVAGAQPAEGKEAGQARTVAETPSFGGLFAEKLKGALKKKPEDKEKDKEKDNDKEKGRDKEKTKKK